MKLSVNTDFSAWFGDVDEPLRQISESGFSYVHWCHHWKDDFLYSYYEVQKIGRLLRQYGLRLFDLHASRGEEKCWCSPDETARLAGEELLLNRIWMTHDLGGRAIILHTINDPLSDMTKTIVEQGIKTLERLEPLCRELGIRIAIENLFDNGGEPSFFYLEKYLSRFADDFVVFCWDTGHANLVKNGIDKIAPFVKRLYALHVQGNHGVHDEHLPAGCGTLDWGRVTRIVADSSYDGPLTQEVKKPSEADSLKFLKDVYTKGALFADEIERLRAAK